MMMTRGDDESLNDLLSAYLDEELDPATAAEVEAHLAADRDARALYDELRATRTLLSSLPRGHAPDDLGEVITSRLERRELLDETNESVPAFSAGRLRAGRLLATAALLAVVCSVGFVIFQGIRDAPDGSASLHRRTETPEMTDSLAFRTPTEPHADGVDERSAAPPASPPKNTGWVEARKEHEERVAAKPARRAKLDTSVAEEPVAQSIAPVAQTESVGSGAAVALRDDAETAPLPTHGLKDRLSEAVAQIAAVLRKPPTSLPAAPALVLRQKSSWRQVASAATAPSVGLGPDAELVVEVRSIATLAVIDEQARRYGATEETEAVGGTTAGRTALTPERVYTVRIDRSELPALVTALRAKPKDAVRLRAFTVGSDFASTWTGVEQLVVRAGHARTTARPVDADRAARKEQYALRLETPDRQRSALAVRKAKRSRSNAIRSTRTSVAAGSRPSPARRRGRVGPGTELSSRLGRHAAKRPARAPTRATARTPEVQGTLPLSASRPAIGSSGTQPHRVGGQAGESSEQITLMLKVYGPPPAAATAPTSQAAPRTSQPALP